MCKKRVVRSERGPIVDLDRPIACGEEEQVRVRRKDDLVNLDWIDVCQPNLWHILQHTKGHETNTSSLPFPLDGS